ncbi:translation initiation factor IF-2-like isoform X4 [Gallus gallus]|uniref:translation initiation factor IF-2-like isoform X4 n=1 Tax=Gallus gallus TaxID=9031 RepID=UPI001AE11E33|nr:translation initiation factor IF-2-like isoform X4 [Gallus gallus]
MNNGRLPQCTGTAAAGEGERERGAGGRPGRRRGSGGQRGGRDSCGASRAPPRPPRGDERGARPLALLGRPPREGPRWLPSPAHARGARGSRWRPRPRGGGLLPRPHGAGSGGAAVGAGGFGGSRDGAAGAGGGSACGTVRRGASPARAAVAAAHVRRVPTRPAALGPLSAGRAKRGRPGRFGGGGGVLGRAPPRSSGAPPLGPSFTGPSDGRFAQKTVRSGREQKDLQISHGSLTKIGKVM